MPDFSDLSVPRAMAGRRRSGAEEAPSGTLLALQDVAERLFSEPDASAVADAVVDVADEVAFAVETAERDVSEVVADALEVDPDAAEHVGFQEEPQEAVEAAEAVGDDAGDEEPGAEVGDVMPIAPPPWWLSAALSAEPTPDEYWAVGLTDPSNNWTFFSIEGEGRPLGRLTMVFGKSLKAVCRCHKCQLMFDFGGDFLSVRNAMVCWIRAGETSSQQEHVALGKVIRANFRSLC